MSLLRVFEPVQDAGIDPAPLQIVAVGLIELARIRHDRRRAAHAPLPLGQGAVIAENADGLLVQGRVVEQVIVFAHAQVAVPGSQRRFIEGQAAVDGLEAEAEHASGEAAHAAVGPDQLHAHHFALQVFQGDAGIVGKQFHRERERARQALHGINAVDEQCAAGTVAVRKRESQDAVVLAVVKKPLQSLERFAHDVSLCRLTINYFR